MQCKYGKLFFLDRILGPWSKAHWSREKDFWVAKISAIIEKQASYTPTLIRKEFIFQQGLKTQAPAQQNVKYMLNFRLHSNPKWI